MGFFTSKDEDTEAALDAQLQEAKEALEAGEIGEEEYEARVTQLQAQRAFLSVAPARNANIDTQLDELEYQREHHWITLEEYENRRRQILGEM